MTPEPERQIIGDHVYTIANVDGAFAMSPDAAALAGDPSPAADERALNVAPLWAPDNALVDSPDAAARVAADHMNAMRGYGGQAMRFALMQPLGDRGPRVVIQADDGYRWEEGNTPPRVSYDHGITWHLGEPPSRRWRWRRRRALLLRWLTAPFRRSDSVYPVATFDPPTPTPEMLEAARRHRRRVAAARRQLRRNLPRVIRAEHIEAIGACPDGVGEFNRAFPDGAPVNRATLHKALRVHHMSTYWIGLLMHAANRGALEAAIRESEAEAERRIHEVRERATAAQDAIWREHEAAIEEVIAGFMENEPAWESGVDA